MKNNKKRKPSSGAAIMAAGTKGRARTFKNKKRENKSPKQATKEAMEEAEDEYQMPYNGL